MDMLNNERSLFEIMRFIKAGMNISNRRGAIIDSWHLKMQAYSNWKIFYFLRMLRALRDDEILINVDESNYIELDNKENLSNSLSLL